MTLLVTADHHKLIISTALSQLRAISCLFHPLFNNNIMGDSLLTILEHLGKWLHRHSTQIEVRMVAIVKYSKTIITAECILQM